MRQQPSPSEVWSTDATASQCRALEQRWLQTVSAAGVQDSLGQPLQSWPQLRSNRFLASFSAQMTREQQAAWVGRLAMLGHAARERELDNLPRLQRWTAADREQLQRCHARQLVQLKSDPGRLAQLHREAQVADSYNGWLRMLGLFPLTREVVLWRVRRFQQAWRHTFGETPSGSRWIRYQPDQPGLAENAPLVDAPEWTPDRLDIPRFADDTAYHRALLKHAPTWWVATNSADDRLGTPVWRAGRREVTPESVSQYHFFSYTRFAGRTLLQLNYQIWFPSRPAAYPGDIYAGAFDGVLWRVTLSPSGDVLFYDSIHPCGCYHLLIIRDPRLQLRDQPRGEEWPLIIDQRDQSSADQGARVWVRSGDHLVIRVETSAVAKRSANTPPEAEVHRYPWRHYTQLHSLPAGDERRSFFASNGLIPDSERSERWLLWPMGIASAGAMRSVGHHAISFASRRHFDDPFLFDTFLHIDW